MDNRITLLDLDRLLADIRQCRACEAVLEPRPVLRASATARLLIVGQAPGARVHATGIPWNDASGERLRDWLQMDKSRFYDESGVAIIPMGFCYPGKGKQGDLPPRPECADLWHQKLQARLPHIELTLLIGSYAQAYYLGRERKSTLTATVSHFRQYLENGFFPLPHPSPRNTLWLKKNAWFAQEVIPVLRERVAQLNLGDFPAA